jgi:hypothetical protein
MIRCGRDTVCHILRCARSGKKARPMEEPDDRCGNGVIPDLGALASGDEHHIPTAMRQIQHVTYRPTHAAPDPIAHHGLAYTSPDSKAKAAVVKLIWMVTED